MITYFSFSVAEVNLYLISSITLQDLSKKLYLKRPGYHRHQLYVDILQRISTSYSPNATLVFLTDNVLCLVIGSSNVLTDVLLAKSSNWSGQCHKVLLMLSSTFGTDVSLPIGLNECEIMAVFLDLIE